MKPARLINELFLDIGGVSLTVGWNYQSSFFVHFREPDGDIFRVAPDIAQVPADQAVYIENRPMFVQTAEGLGIRGILGSPELNGRDLVVEIPQV